MLRYFLTINIFIFSLSVCKAGNIIPYSTNPGVHAVYRGMWAVFDNPAGCVKTTSFTAGVSYHSSFLLSEMAEQSFALLLPVHNSGNVGAGYQQFGYDLYKEQRACLLYSRSFGTLMEAGVRFDYLATRFGQDYGNSNAITGSAGIIFRITEPLRAGICIFNPQRAAISKETDANYPAVIEAGISWTFRTGAELAFGISKASDSKEIPEAGLIYPVSKKFMLHVSVSGGAEPVTFGYSFRLLKFEIGMASGYHHELGFSPRMSLTFQK